MKTGHKSMFNSLPRSFNCLRTKSADFCSLNGRTIRTDCRSGVELRGGVGVCLDVIKLEIMDCIRSFIRNVPYSRAQTVSKYSK